MLRYLLLLNNIVWRLCCNLALQLTDENMQNMPKDCETMNGNLQIHTNVNQSLLTRMFRNVNTILGCVTVKNTNLKTLDFMKHVRLINCSLNLVTTANVIDIYDNMDLTELKFDSLDTIIGPGSIEFGVSPAYEFCFSQHELELFLFHPQFSVQRDSFMDRWMPMRKRCGNGCDIRYTIDYRHPPPDSIQIPTGCRVLNEFYIRAPGFGYITLLDNLKDVRIILGEIVIESTFLANLSFFHNVEMIYTYQEGPPINMKTNPYLSDISLPKLRQVIGPEISRIDRKTMVVLVEGSPHLPTNNPFPNVITSDKVRITSRKRRDGDAFKFRLLTYGIYYGGITTSVLFNSRAVVLFVFGSAVDSIGGLRWFFTAFSIVHLLIAGDSILFYHDLSLIYFTPAALLRNVILYNDALLVFCKTVFVTREIAMYLPFAAIVYIFIAAAMSLFKRSMKFPTLVYFLMVVIYCVFAIVSMFSTVKVRARRTMNKLLNIKNGAPRGMYSVRRDGDSPMDKYAMIAGINSIFAIESFFNRWTAEAICEKTIYTDGLYAVLRYATLRNYLIRNMYPITCVGYVECAELYSYDHTVAVLTHHGIYVLMAFNSLLVWYTARYFHYLGNSLKKEKAFEDARILENNSNSRVHPK